MLFVEYKIYKNKEKRSYKYNRNHNHIHNHNRNKIVLKYSDKIFMFDFILWLA